MQAGAMRRGPQSPTPPGDPVAVRAFGHGAASLGSQAFPSHPGHPAGRAWRREDCKRESRRRVPLGLRPTSLTTSSSLTFGELGQSLRRSQARLRGRAGWLMRVGRWELSRGLRQGVAKDKTLQCVTAAGASRDLGHGGEGRGTTCDQDS